ncbi:activating signal cointegrator 1 complex subunit 2 [Anopheles nili]|uniref:activating signal cointegrator 1 complex subunit 2 n=1 Tax=Anopheles nili TaxID=185578 RepID=UPI00237B206E|nr:activating signal cointegrator 1 complex subunit 2 [Anopheles nili]
MVRRIVTDGIPLNSQKINISENGTVPALHITWKDSRCFTKYTGFKIEDADIVNQSNLEQWFNETEWFIKDMKYLLKLEHHRFWSTILHNSSAMESVISFMQNALPFYLNSVLQTLENERFLLVYSSAHALVFRVCCRITTMQESKWCWMEADFYAKLIYKKFIVTVPFLFDMVSIYGKDNAEEMSRIIEFILKLQPNYTQDIKQGLSYLLNAFVVIQKRCETELIQPSVSEETLNDLALYAQDCCCILMQLVEISPSVRHMSSELNIEFVITNFYENVLTALYRSIQDMNKHSRFLTQLNDMRVGMLDTFRSILIIQLEKILENSDENLLAADKFINILTECLVNSTFVNDYKNVYDIEDDLKIVQLGYKSVEQVKYDFIQKAYAIEKDFSEQRILLNIPTEPLDEFDVKTSNDHSDYVVGQENAAFEQQIELNVQQIKDLLPHLGVEHIRNVVCCCDKVEQAVSILLENNFSETNQSQHDELGEVNIPIDPLDEFYLRTGIDRLNIYDGDELDVMVNDKVKGIIKKGKGMPGQAKTINELLDDKSHIQQVRHIYQQFDLIAENEVDDDEYDDSFEAMAESESRHVKLVKGARNILADEEQDNESESEKDNESEHEQDSNRNVALAFCENPEIARQRYENRLSSKYLRRHGTVASVAKDADVRGKPKGQGQDSKVLLNRKHKNENKAFSGNHNRKQGASYKRNRGMLPS